MADDIEYIIISTYYFSHNKFEHYGWYILFLTQSLLLTTLYKNRFENITGKGDNAGNLFPQCILPFPKQISIFSAPEHNVLKGSFRVVRCPSCVVNNFFKHLLLPNH